MNLFSLELMGTEKLSGECERLCDHMSRPVIGEISLFLPEFVFLPLTTTSFVLPLCWSPGTIPPDIGNLVKLAVLRLDSTKIEGATKIRVMVITCPGQ